MAMYSTSIRSLRANRSNGSSSSHSFHSSGNWSYVMVPGLSHERVPSAMPTVDGRTLLPAFADGAADFRPMTTGQSFSRRPTRCP